MEQGGSEDLLWAQLCTTVLKTESVCVARMQITFTLLVITGNYFTFGFLRTLLQFQITVKLKVTKK